MVVENPNIQMFAVHLCRPPLVQCRPHTVFPGEPGLHRDAAEQFLEVVMLAGGQHQGLGTVVGVQQDHAQSHPPLVVRDIRGKVPVPGDEHNPRPAPAVNVGKS